MNNLSYVADIKLSLILKEKNIKFPVLYFRISKNFKDFKIDDLVLIYDYCRYELNRSYAVEAPLLYDVQKYIRDKFNVHINIFLIDKNKFSYSFDTIDTFTNIYTSYEYFESYEECLNESLYKYFKVFYK